MRLLMLHVDYFSCRAMERGRSKTVENIDPNSQFTQVGQALVILASVEKRDEVSPENVSKNAVDEVKRLAHLLGVDTVVLHPFAHLFGELSTPEVAVKTLRLTEEGLLRKGLKVVRTPFGWFNTLELKAKGHPLSRVARIISAN